MNLHHDEVRKQRSTLAVCPSAKENVCVTDILYEIIEKETYKKDYEEITLGLLFVPETYDTVIQSIKRLQIVESGIRINGGFYTATFLFNPHKLRLSLPEHRKVIKAGVF